MFCSKQLIRRSLQNFKKQGKRWTNNKALCQTEHCVFIWLTGHSRSQSKAWVCDRSLAVTVGSNPAGDMNVCLLWMLCVVRYRFTCRADHSSRGVLPSVVCLSVIVKPPQWGGSGPLRAVTPWKKKLDTTGWIPLNSIYSLFILRVLHTSTILFSQIWSP
jgi:hypothetical protein